MFEDCDYVNNKSVGTYKIEIDMKVKWLNFSKCSMQPMEMKVQRHPQ